MNELIVTLVICMKEKGMEDFMRCVIYEIQQLFLWFVLVIIVVLCCTYFEFVLLAWLLALTSALVLIDS